MLTARHSRIFLLDDPRVMRVWAVVGLLGFALVAGFAATQESMKYPAAVALVCFMVLFRKWEEPYVLAGAVFLFILAGVADEGLAEKGITYRWHGLLLLISIGWFRTAYERRWHAEMRPLFLGMIAWGGYILWSTLWAWDLTYSLPRAVAIVFVGVAVFFSLWRYMEGWRQLTLVLKSLTLVLIPVLLAQFRELGATSAEGRFPGMMSHVNTLGLLAMISVPLGIYVMLDLPVTNRWRAAGASLTALGLVLGVLCASRSALVAMLIGLGVYLFLRNPLRVLAFLASVALLLAILVGYDVDILETFHLQILVRPETLSTGTNRLTAWAIGWQQHRDNPIWGYGFSSAPFLLAETSYISITKGLSLGRYHNSYVELLVETGWLGMTPFLLFISYLVAKGVRAVSNRDLGPLRRRAVLGLGAVVIAGLVHGVFESWFFSPGAPVTLLWWSIVGCWMKVALEPERFAEPPSSREP